MRESLAATTYAVYRTHRPYTRQRWHIMIHQGNPTGEHSRRESIISEANNKAVMRRGDGEDVSGSRTSTDVSKQTSTQISGTKELSGGKAASTDER